MKWKPNNEQRVLLESLKSEQLKEKTVAEFARKFLPFGVAKWLRIMDAIDESKTDSYFDVVKDKDTQLAELEELLERILLRRAAAAREDASLRVLPLAKFRAVATAVRACMDIAGPERLVKYLAPTGGGKTMLSNYLGGEFDLRVVESRDAWRRSYYTFLTDVCRATRVSVAGETRPSAIEDALIKALSDKTLVLYIDEAEFFGREALNGLKLLLNRTRVVPVIAAIPEAHDRWNRYYPMEADQIARRTDSVVQLSIVDPKDCGLFFSEKQFEDRHAELSYLCAKCSAFGHYSLLRRVASKLQGTQRVDHAEVEKAVESSLIAMRRNERGKKLLEAA